MSHIISLFEPALLADLVNFDGFIISIITTDTVERFAKFVGVHGSQKIVFMSWLVGHFFVNHRKQRYKDCTSWWFLQHSKPNKGSSGSACCKTKQWKSFAMFNWSSRKEVIPLVSYPARWSFPFILGPLHWSSICPTSREHRNIVQLCTIILRYLRRGWRIISILQRDMTVFKEFWTLHS